MQNRIENFSVLYKKYCTKVGENKEKITDDFKMVTDRYFKLYPSFWASLLTIIIYSVFLLKQSSLVSIILLFISFIQLIPPIIVKNFMRKNYEDTRDIEAEITNFILEGIDGFMTIKLYQLKSWWMQNMDRLNADYLKIGNQSICTSQAEIMMNRFCSNLLSFGTYGIIGVIVLHHQISLEVGIQAIALSGSLYAAVNAILALIPQFGVTDKAEDRIRDWFTFAEEKKEVVKTCFIEMKNVSKTIEGKEIFSNVTFTRKREKIILLKGENGTGKSTLMKMMIGLLPIEDGEITIDGINPSKLSLCNFPSKLCYLPQDDLPLEITVLELCNMVAPEQMEYMRELLKRFDLREQDLKNKKINELSGGERKKVFLSLMFAIKPKLLFIDEPTNALDEKGKYVLLDIMQSYEEGIILISHETLFDNMADYIYYIKAGGNSCV